MFHTSFIEPSDAVYDKNGNDVSSLGYFINPQVSIGKYRVDFVVSLINSDHHQKRVIVECDGHDFHDKDKKQRAYEKGQRLS